jgi:hypothetical protein
VPDRARIADDVRRGNERAPLRAMIPRTIVERGKVVGQTSGEEGNAALDIEDQATIMAQVVGISVAETVRRAAAQVGLTANHLVTPLGPLHLDEGTLALIRTGCERMIAGDFVSATHVTVHRIEDVLRQHLKAVGVDTTEFRPARDGTSRTDDAPLGSLLRRSLPDGRTVRDYLGADLWEHVKSVLNSPTGLNLRNEFAHGLARPAHCTPSVAGIALSLLYLLAERAGRGGTPPRQLHEGSAS